MSRNARDFRGGCPAAHSRLAVRPKEEIAGPGSARSCTHGAEASGRPGRDRESDEDLAKGVVWELGECWDIALSALLLSPVVVHYHRRSVSGTSSVDPSLLGLVTALTT